MLFDQSAHSPFVLRRGVVDVWFVDLALLNLGQSTCFEFLDGTERSIADGFQSPSLRGLYVQGHGLLRMLLGGYLRVSPAALKVGRALYGKPFLVDHPELSFNLSHSGSKWLLAVTAAVPVGVDIELIKPRSQTAGLVARCFAAEEQVYWQALSEAEKLPRFFEFWTRKEAFVKAVGRGIALGLDQCVIDLHHPHRFLRVPTEAGRPDMWRFTDLAVDAACYAAMVVKLSSHQIKILAVADYLRYLV